MKVFIFDAERCNGCYGCQVACKDEHVGNDWMPYAKPQPNTGQFWLKVKEKDHGQVPKVFVEYTPWLCMHCDQPACQQAAPDAVYKREDGLVIIDPVKSEGKRELAASCPYGAIYWNEELKIAQKCTGCAHLVDEGKIPHCVDLCATGGLSFGEEADFAEEIAKAEIMLPESDCRPRVYYLNLPKLFLAGEVWDPSTNDIIEGASISLVTPEGKTYQTSTDDFGDFWFRKLNRGVYSLKIEAQGFETVEKSGIELSESLNIGDFPLKKLS
ncbi:carboxypeptidase regulatory-like domain-containing protein [Dehalobacter sp. DCM]|uniref:4Fe-4S dicluster domain-containing protein n=1 Tax=Dehalobacter sp. DCM TaxID=2907827 RepID=UPI0030819EFA|nr:carboxypeptidase regulatory-like domain-containing protein [Dehalobacter sp. DCM]